MFVISLLLHGVWAATFPEQVGHSKTAITIIIATVVAHICVHILYDIIIIYYKYIIYSTEEATS